MAAPSFIDIGATGVNGSNGTSVVISFSATGELDIVGEATNDYALIAIYKESTATITQPGGWTDYGTFVQNTGGFKYQGQIYGKLLTGTETTQTWSWTGSTWRYAELVVYRNTETLVDPVPTITGDEETNQTNNPVHPGITIANAESALVWFVFNFSDISNTTAPTGFTHRVAAGTTLARNALTYDDVTTTTGATGTVSGTLGGSIDWPLTVLLELASAIGVGTAVGAAMQSLPPSLVDAPYVDRYSFEQSTPLPLTAGGVVQTLDAAGTITSAGTLTNLQVRLLAVAGSIASAGNLIRQPAIRFTATIASAGTLLKSVTQSLAGTLTLSGALANLQVRLLSVAGTLTSSGALTNIQVRLLSAAGTLTSASTITWSVSKRVAGAITSSSVLTNLQVRLLSVAGAITSSSTLANLQVRTLDLAGTLTSSGALTRRVNLAFAAALTPTSTLIKSVTQRLVGSITPTGAATNARTRFLSAAGTLASAGTLIRQPVLSILASIASSSTLRTPFVSHQLSGSLTPTSTLATVRAIFVSLAGALSFTGDNTNTLSQNLRNFVWIVKAPARKWSARAVSSRWRIRGLKD